MEPLKPTPRPPQSRMPSEGEARDLAKQLQRVGSRSGPTRTEARGNGGGGRSDARAWLQKAGAQTGPFRMYSVAHRADGAVLRSARDRAHSGRVCQKGVNTLKVNTLKREFL
jgi:hypothetical protein